MGAHRHGLFDFGLKPMASGRLPLDMVVVAVATAMAVSFRRFPHWDSGGFLRQEPHATTERTVSAPISDTPAVMSMVALAQAKDLIIKDDLLVSILAGPGSSFLTKTCRLE